MKFSIITPVYNAENYIGKAIESVLNQEFSDWELIIINNGSTDKTLQVVEEYAMRDSRIKVIKCSENSGSPARPRNLGLQAAKGEYVGFLDADDCFYPEKLKEVNNFFIDNPDAELVCHGEDHFKNNTLVRSEYYGPYTTYKDLFFCGNSLSTSAIVVKKACIEKAGFFSEGNEFSGFEDYEYWLRLAKVSKIKYLYKILGKYTVNDNTEAAKIAKNCANALRFLENHYSQWQNKSLRYRLLFRKRKALLLRASGRELIRAGEFAQASSVLFSGIAYYPFEIKQWGLLTLSFFKKRLD